MKTYLTWDNDRADVWLDVHKIQYKNESKDVIKFRGSIFHKKSFWKIESKNWKMKLSAFRDLVRINGKS